MTLGYELGELPRGELLSEEPGVGPAPPAIPPRPAPPAVSLAGPPPRPDLRAAPPAPPAHGVSLAGPPPRPDLLSPPPMTLAAEALVEVTAEEPRQEPAFNVLVEDSGSIGQPTEEVDYVPHVSAGPTSLPLAFAPAPPEPSPPETPALVGLGDGPPLASLFRPMAHSMAAASPSPTPPPVHPGPVSHQAPSQHTHSPAAEPPRGRAVEFKPQPETGPPAPGRVFGDYRLEALLGQGGSASVWRAFDTRLHMNIAIKLFNPRTKASRATLTQVMREARAASKVVSDHVIRVKDAGFMEEHNLGFIAMELCADYPDARDLAPGEKPQLLVGKSLEAALPETLRGSLSAVAQAARGVSDAHREGIFHRDVKPANVLVRPGSRRAQITDFGLTVADLSTSGGSVRIPVKGNDRRFILGTPEYMAPEAAAGLPLDLDPVRDRALLVGLDVYGLGATLYALLAGATPYRARPEATDLVQDILDQVAAGPPKDLTERVSNRFPLPDSVVRVVRRAIHRDPDERYASASELVDDLEAILHDQPTSLDGPFPLTRAQLYLRRNRLQVSAAASVAVLLAALGATAVVGVRLKDQMREAQGTIVNLTGEGQAAKAEAQEWQATASKYNSKAEEAAAREAEALQDVAATASDLKTTQQRLAKTIAERDMALAEGDLQRGRAEAAEGDLALSRAEALSQKERAEGAERELATSVAAEKSQRERAELAEGDRDQARSERDQELARAEAAEAQSDKASLDEARRELAEEEAARAAAERRVNELKGTLDAQKALSETQKRELTEAQKRIALLEAAGASTPTP
ncbi:MAG: protein kinase [Deltaproteobacteria bacterium]|nr:protein kinase [Deltaproteobacteria bacterium]